MHTLSRTAPVARYAGVDPGMGGASAVTAADAAGVRDASVLAEAPSSALGDLREIVHDLRGSRALIYQLTLRDVRVRYKQAAMGFAWAILTPLLVVAAGVFVRAMLVRAGRVPLDHLAIAGVTAKGVAWAFVSGAIGMATTSLSGNAALVSKVYFPREVLPLSVVLASTFDALVGAAALGLLLPLLGWHPGWAVLWMPVLAVVLFTLVLALALVVSCANLFFRDVKYVVQIAITFGVLFTPVFYEPAMVGEQWVALQMLNPVTPILEGLRLVVAGHNLAVTLPLAGGALAWTPWYLLYSAVWAVGALGIGAVLFHRAQYRFAEYV